MSTLVARQNRFLYRIVNAIDDVLRWLRVDKIAWWPFYALAKCRQWLTEGKTRRLLRRAVRSWVRTGGYSQSYFRSDEVRVNLGDQMIVVTIQKQPKF